MNIKLLSGGGGGKRGYPGGGGGGGGATILNGITPPPSPAGIADGTLYVQYPDSWFLTALYEQMRKTKDGITLIENLDFDDFDTDILLENGSWYAMANHGMQICLAGFIAAANGLTNCIVTTLDGGITWQKTRDDGLFDYVNGLAWGNGVWVAVGSGANSMAYSIDGRHWVGLGVNNPLVEGFCVKWNGTQFVAGGAPAIATDPVLQYSSDGITWNNGDLAGSVALTNASMLTWDGTRWYINTSYQALDMAYSANGINWTQYTPVGIGIKYPLSLEYGAPIAGTPVYVLVGRSAVGGLNSIAYSLDAVNWVNLGVTLELRLDRVAWDGNLFMAVSSDQTINSLVFSPDGVNWTGAGINLPYGGYHIGVTRTNNSSYPTGVYICKAGVWVKTTMF
jgi:hypothetical protein